MPRSGISSRATAVYPATMLLPLLLLASTPTPPPASDPAAELSKGSALYRVCKAEVRLMDLPSLGKAAQSDLLNGSYCVGYLNGFVANLTPAATFCPKGAPMGELVRSYVEFLEKNPDLLDKDRRLGLGLALQSAYPCPSLPSPGSNVSGFNRVVFSYKP